MSKPIFVDTNVFLRFFVADVDDLYERARRLFERSEKGEVNLTTSELVIAEIIWVLESYYGFSKSEIYEVIKTLLNTRGLKIMNSRIIQKAIELYMSENIDFIDAYNGSLITIKSYGKVATFDRKHFNRIDNIEIVDF